MVLTILSMTAASANTAAFGGVLQIPYGEVEEGVVETPQFGLRGQLNLNPVFAVRADVFAGEREYYISTGPTFYGPYSWESLSQSIDDLGVTVSKNNYYYFTEIYELVFSFIGRIPLGIFEPFAGVGASVSIDSPNSSGSDWENKDQFKEYINDNTDNAIDYTLRAGLDVHFSSWAALGAELSWRYEELADMFAEIQSFSPDSSDQYLGRSQVGISAVMKF